MKRANFWVLCCCLLVACQQSAKVGEDSDSVDDTDTVTTTTPTDSTDDTSTGDSATNNTATMDTESTSDTEPLPEPVENEWIFIEGGTFEMGSELFEYSQPVHTVNVPSFEILKTEVTTHQYRQCVDAGVCSEPDTISSNCKYKGNNWIVPAKRNDPVNCVTYFFATEYCEWLGGRLPSEAEWEYAARGGGENIDYPWGNDEPSCDLAVMRKSEDLWCYPYASAPVCSVVAGNTEQGLCDMAGNLGEWVSDIVPKLSDYTEAPSDGSARTVADAEYAVIRGGDSSSFSRGMHVAFRGWLELDIQLGSYIDYTTMRCVREKE